MRLDEIRARISVSDEEAIATLRALAQQARWQIMHTLLRSDSSQPVNAIAAELDLLQNSVSTHLAILERAGLVTFARAGRQILYCADRSRLRELMAAIDRLIP